MYLVRSFSLAVAAVVAMADGSSAQLPTPPFELLDPRGQLLDDVRPLLARRVGDSKQNELDPKLLKDLIDKLPKDKANQQEIENWLKNNPEFNNQDFLKQLGKMTESPNFPQNLKDKLPKGVNPPTENPETFKENVNKVIESGQKQMWPEGGSKDGSPKGQSGASDPSKSADPNAGKAGDNEWVKWMQKNFGESDAGKSAVKDLMSALEKQNSKGMFDNIPEFKNGGWKDFDSWGKANAGDLWKMKPPDMSGTKMTSPNIGGSGLGGGSSSGSSGGGGSSGGIGGAGGGIGGAATPLAIIAAIAAAIFLAVLLMRKWKMNREQHAAGALAGKDGIDFDSIRTREQLVTAFDHVSLDQIGEEARTWNHRVIADEFADTRPVYAEPANELAGLYERARYAPNDEDLTNGEFADARRDLRTIAGVTP